MSRQWSVTMFEVFSVILIIGILATIAIPMLLGQRDKARNASAQSTLRNAFTVSRIFYATAESYTGLAEDESSFDLVVEVPIGAGSWATEPGDADPRRVLYAVSTDGKSLSLCNAGRGSESYCIVDDRTTGTVVYRASEGAPAATLAGSGTGVRSWK